MKEYATTEWQRAVGALEIAEHAVRTDPDSAASRAYYAAFHALTALFALRGQTFTKHTAVRAALHRDLIRSGEWAAKLGHIYDRLMDLRERGDYGGVARVSWEDARTSVDSAAEIVEAVRQSCPELEQDSSDSAKQDK